MNACYVWKFFSQMSYPKLCSCQEQGEETETSTFKAEQCAT